MRNDLRLTLAQAGILRGAEAADKIAGTAVAVAKVDKHDGNVFERLTVLAFVDSHVLTQNVVP